MLMACHAPSMATDPSEDVHHRVPEPFHIQTNSIVHAPLSPPPSVKRSAFLPPTSLEREHDSQKSSGEYTSTRLRGFQDPRRIRVRLFLILAALLGLFCWSRGRSAQGFRDLKETANILLLPSALDGFHFIPASNPHFHVRAWTALLIIITDHVSMSADGHIPLIDFEETVTSQVIES